MAVANRIEKQSYGNRKEILIAPENAESLSVIVGDTGIVADGNGRKIIKAGTPIGSETDVFENRKTVLQKEDTNVQGILLHDVDVTAGDQNAAMVYKGTIDLLKLDETTRALITPTVKEALPLVVFIKGNL